MICTWAIKAALQQPAIMPCQCDSCLCAVAVQTAQEARDIFGDNIEDLLEDFAIRRGANAEAGNADADEAVGEDLDDEMDVQDRHTEQVGVFSDCCVLVSAQQTDSAGLCCSTLVQF